MTHNNPHRGYRLSHAHREGETSFQLVVEESDLWVIAQRDLRREMAASITRLRAELKNWILLRPEFRASLSPVPVPDSAPKIVRHMAEAAAIANVGPFAAVAGAIAQALAEEFSPQSPELLIENGGDTFICSSRERHIGILADPSGEALLSVLVRPEDCPVSFCGSSARIGHSLSFGQSDLVVVRAKDAALADACATTLGNLLRSAEDVPAVLKRAQGFAQYGLEGIFAQCQGKIVLWGKMELA
jgi:ApbE superfamily uncharacterized protein (UPF0280 family)